MNDDNKLNFEEGAEAVSNETGETVEQPSEQTDQADKPKRKTNKPKVEKALETEAEAEAEAEAEVETETEDNEVLERVKKYLTEQVPVLFDYDGFTTNKKQYMAIHREFVREALAKLLEGLAEVTKHAG